MYMVAVISVTPSCYRANLQVQWHNFRVIPCLVLKQSLSCQIGSRRILLEPILSSKVTLFEGTWGKDKLDTLKAFSI
jgi:hypothetical protein